ncbi:tRNA (adenosine(37)-N6)-dimethylallyltransferase MiaA [Dokdonella fugitiva]|jgi:tRNA dimethylallyltransferase|uniref:tRNA dimethylallyltransferase n=1 Tax=Dokdonella fugitiva TaxID=328517 RepID=A0A4R2HXF6_9GAMM|nr:tRNA (adenosine(37)-N6)-dimethylallyltransferase MiaA [Dokdonella fugitiva]MBA8885629.1 tRNA dimethylallyltransferase [Dokdonella fugitiva]TCO36281.1 tRNA dimethylallyltransferase [Dokdonella fugitiva]
MNRTDQRPRAIFLMGPTASGKTALACLLAERFGLDLVSVDSALVYRGLDIGAAKPDAATLARHPHRLVDIRDPAQAYSAADFRADALAAMDEITRAGRVPLLVGGTGLYFRALEHGLSALPDADPDVRRRLADEAREAGWATLHERLRRLDPLAAERIRPGDAQRIQRALEVIELSGRPLSAQQDGPRSRLPWRVLKLALVPAERSLLHERIARRFDAMLAEGFLDEARRLRADPAWHPDLPAMRAVGYRQAWPCLDGEIDVATFRDRAVFATRQLAKRQITWLRSELDARWFDPDRGTLADDASRALALFGLGGDPSS